MSDATLQILRDAVKAAPFTYTVPGEQLLGLVAVRASFDGSGAAGAFLPAVQILSAAGAVMVHAEGTSVAAGASADASFFPGVKAAAGSAYKTVQDEGVALTQREILDFAGAGVTATDDAANSRTLVTIPGGGGGGGDGCRVYNTTDESIATATSTALSFDTEIYDVGGMFDPIGDPTHLTVQTAGKYLVGGNVYFDADATGYRGLQLHYTGLGGVIFALVYLPSAGAVIGTALNISAVMDLAATEQLQLRVRQTSGGNLNVHSQVYYSPQFWAQKLA